MNVFMEGVSLPGPVHAKIVEGSLVITPLDPKLLGEIHERNRSSCNWCRQQVGLNARHDSEGNHLDSLSCNTERMVGAMDRLTGTLAALTSPTCRCESCFKGQGLPNDQDHGIEL